METKTITAISKMIASGEIPSEVYDKYLSKTKLGFCTEEKVEETIIKEATQDDKKILQILKEKKVNISNISYGIENGKSINDLMDDNRFFCKLKLFELDENATESEQLEFHNKIEKMNLTKEEMTLIIEWLKEE